MLVTQCSASDMKLKKPISECTKEERQYICHMLRELIENTDKLKIDFKPAVSFAAKAIGAIGLSAISLLISVALFGKSGLLLEVVSGDSPEEKRMFASVAKSGNEFMYQTYTEEYMNALQKANKIKSSLQIFAEKTNIDLSQVVSQIDSFVARNQELSWSNKRQIRDEKGLLSQIFVDNASVFDAVKNSEGPVSKMTRKFLR